MVTLAGYDFEREKYKNRNHNTRFADENKGFYVVAESEGRIVGGLMITYEWSDWRNTNVWWIQSVYVVPELRRTGIFSSMYSFIKKEAEKQNAAGLRLYVEKSNSKAQNTYETLGMKSEHYTMYEWLKD